MAFSDRWDSLGDVWLKDVDDDEVAASPFSFVYFVQGEGGGPIKIGLSTRPHHRLKNMQTSSPQVLKMRRLVRVHRDKRRTVEMMLHRQFGHLRIRGEWFRATPELAHIADAVPERPDDPGLEALLVEIQGRVS